MPLPIEDYAVIGDTQTAALVGRDGSIDWLCLRGFDSGACFAALLGSPQHGRWPLGPVGGEHAPGRRYRGDSLVLEHEFRTAADAARRVDCMPPRVREPDLVRVVAGVWRYSSGCSRCAMTLACSASSSIRGPPVRSGTSHRRFRTSV